MSSECVQANTYRIVSTYIGEHKKGLWANIAQRDYNKVKINLQCVLIGDTREI